MAILAYIQRLLRSFVFRVTATVLVVSLLLFFSQFLITVFDVYQNLKQHSNPSWNPLVSKLENSFFIGIISLCILGIIVIAAILDLISFMRTTYQFRRVSSTIIKFANGNLDIRIHNTADGPIGDLQKSFNKMADTVAESINRLEELNQFKRELVANVAHDLGSPLTSILGYLDTIKLKMDTISEEELKKYLDVAHSNALYLSKLVNDLAALSNLDSKEFSPNFERLSVKELVEEVAKRFATRAEDKGVDFKVNNISSLNYIRGDSSLLQRALANIVENAVNFSEKGGSISIDIADTVARDITISVTDNGPGIAREHIPFLFERFYRVGKERARKSGGSGLGLAIVKNILDMHNARVVVDSDLGKSTCFTLSFPVLETQEMDNRKADNFNSFEETESGATLVEYALLVALLALVSIAAITVLGQGISEQFSDLEALVVNP